MTDEIAVTPELFEEIQDIMSVPIDDPRLPWNAGEIDRYADFIAGSQTDLKPDALSNIAENYGKRVEYHLRGAWRAGYDWLHIYEAGPELGRQGLSDTFIFHREYIPSNSPPRGGRRDGYKFSYDLTSVPDDVIRAAIRGEVNTTDF